MQKIIVAWLAPYPLTSIKSIVFSRQVQNIGTGTWLVNLAKELIKNRDLELHIIIETGNIPFSQDFHEDGIWFHLVKNTLPFLKRGIPSFFPIQELSLYLVNSIRINKVLKKIAPHIVHAHGTENAYAVAATRCKYLNIISIQGVLKEIAKYESTFRLKLKEKLEEKSVKDGSNFICRTNLDVELIRSLNHSAKIFIIHEAMNPVFFKNYWQVDSDKSILYVGSVQERKGIMVLLKAVKEVKDQIKDIKLFIIGRGKQSYINSLVKYCSDNGFCDNVVFVGYQPSQIIADYHIKTQLLICPSFIENSPNNVAEAMVSGLPVIASNTGGIPSMIDHKESGYLFETGNSLQLAEQIKFLLTNPDERKRISCNAMEIARKRHLPQQVAKETLIVYKRLIDEYPSRQ